MGHILVGMRGCAIRRPRPLDCPQWTIAKRICVLRIQVTSLHLSCYPSLSIRLMTRLAWKLHFQAPQICVWEDGPFPYQARGLARADFRQTHATPGRRWTGAHLTCLGCMSCNRWHTRYGFLYIPRPCSWLAQSNVGTASCSPFTQQPGKFSLVRRP